MPHSWDARDYRANASMQLLLGGSFLERLPLVEDARVLDVGCGDGRVSAQVAARVPRGSVTGVDRDPGMVAFAREAHPELRFAVRDARELGFDAEFDAAVSFTALHWVVEEHDRALDGMRRAVVPGGLVAATFPAAGNMALLSAVADEVCADPRWRSSFEGHAFPWFFPERSAYARLVERVGLEIGSLARVPYDVVHDGRDALAGWIRTTWMPFTTRLPEDRRAAWIDEVVARYAQEAPPDAEGRLHVPSFRIELVARRRPGDA